MQFSHILTAFVATVVVAAPSAEEAQALEPKGCLPSSCDDYGVSKNCSTQYQSGSQKCHD